jgi:cation transport regulator ChaC
VRTIRRWSTAAPLRERETCKEGSAGACVDLLTQKGMREGFCYVADGAHPAVGDSPEEDLRKSLQTAKGIAGPNLDYAARTISSIRAIRSPAGWPTSCLGMAGRTAAAYLCPVGEGVA